LSGSQRGGFQITPGTVKLLGSPGKAGGFPFVLNQRPIFYHCTSALLHPQLDTNPREIPLPSVGEARGEGLGLYCMVVIFPLTFLCGFAAEDTLFQYDKSVSKKTF